jgi:hypothetical protein
VRDERTLRGLVGQAFWMRDSPYFVDAIQAIVEWHEQRYERDLHRRMDLVQLIRESYSSRRSSLNGRDE